MTPIEDDLAPYDPEMTEYARQAQEHEIHVSATAEFWDHEFLAPMTDDSSDYDDAGQDHF